MTPEERTAITGRSIILFDGACGLCNGVVRLLLRLDRGGALRFVPLESSLAAELRAPFPTPPDEPEGVLLLAGALRPAQTLFRRSEAVAEAFRRIDGLWPFVGALVRFVPNRLREAGYAFIARHRYRLFGRYATCPIPTMAERSRILGIAAPEGSRPAALIN